MFYYYISLSVVPEEEQKISKLWQHISKDCKISDNALPRIVKSRGRKFQKVSFKILEPEKRDNADKMQSKNNTCDSPSAKEEPMIFKGRDFEFSMGVIQIFRSKDSYDNMHESTDISLQTKELSKSITGELLLCALSVPSYITYRDFIKFLGSYQYSISHLYIIADELSERFIYFIGFREKQVAEEFYNEYNGKKFTSIHDEICSLVYVESLVFRDNDKHVDSPINELDKIELPKCPVCLDKLDGTATGLLTIVCRHTFHINCLISWENSTCPVCRYDRNNIAGISKNECADCRVRTDLWICLICGRIGCGRYSSGHSKTHCDEYQHIYAMSLDTKRVWDYAGDVYIHRLIQNKSDGKLVELQAPNGNFNSTNDECKMDLPDEDLDTRCVKIKSLNGSCGNNSSKGSACEEYMMLMIAQMESQKLWYEGHSSQMNYDFEQKQLHYEKQLEELENKNKTLLEEKEKLQKKINSKNDKLNVLSSKLQDAERALKDEKSMNLLLCNDYDPSQEKIESLNKTIKQKDKEINELLNQVRDLMAFIEISSKVNEGGGDNNVYSEIRGGQVGIPFNLKKIQRKRNPR